MNILEFLFVCKPDGLNGEPLGEYPVPWLFHASIAQPEVVAAMMTRYDKETGAGRTLGGANMELPVA
jgi:hypothetical protein